MRISDWSSDVCSSDLPHRTAPGGKPYMPWHDSTMILAGPVGNALADLGNERWQRATKKPLRDLTGKGENWPGERKSVVRGKSEAARVELGGRRIIKENMSEEERGYRTTRK